MALRSYGNKRDANEPGIVAALRKCGCSVYPLDKPCDLLVGFRGKTHLVEVKTKHGIVTKPQVEFAETWTGEPVAIVRSADEAIDLVRKWSAASG